MIVLRFIVLFFVFILLEANPTYQNDRKYEHRQRRSRHFMKWHSADSLYKFLYKHNDFPVHIDQRSKRSELPVELRPLEGPISIEQLLAVLAARYVKRYPYSQLDDPATIGR